MVENERAPKTWSESLGDGQFEGDRWYHVLTKALLPALVYLASYSIIAGAYGADMAGEWVNLTFLFVVPPMGTATLIPLGMTQGFSALTMALTVTMVDAVIALYVVWWLVLLKKIPGIGKLFLWLEEKAGRKVEEDDRLKKGSWLFIYSALLIPIQGSGGMNMAVIGRILGLRADHVVSAIVAGSLTIALATAFMATVGNYFLEWGLVPFVLFIMIMVQVGLIAYHLKNMRDMRKWETELAERA